MILDVYVSSNRASKYVKQKLIELAGKIYKFTVGDFNIHPLSYWYV